jgi:hypothetical protein
MSGDRALEVNSSLEGAAKATNESRPGRGAEDNEIGGPA